MKREKGDRMMNKGIKKFLSLLLSISLMVPVWGTDVLAAGKGEVTICVLETSDLHGKFLPYDYAVNEESTSGSLAQVQTAVNQYRKGKEDRTLLIDCGDIIQDNSADLFLNDEIHPMIAGMNLMKYDAIVAGNHEFNYGIPKLQQIMSKSNAAFLCGNVYDSTGQILGAPYKIFEKKGVKIAVIGMVTPNIQRWDAINLNGYLVTDPVAETKRIIDSIKDDVDIIIAAEHMGEENEYGVSDSGIIDLANACPEIDLILAAHEHKQVNGTLYNNIPVLENKNQGATLAKAEITLKRDAAGKYQITQTATEVLPMKDVKPSLKMEKKLASYDARAKEDANVVIGQLAGGNLVPADEIKGIPQGQLQETALIHLINEVQMYYDDADVSAAAMFNTSANMLEGPIRKCDTALIYKYSNTLYKVKMTGKQLKKYMEWSAKYYNTCKPGDLTVSFNEAVRAYNYDMFTGVNYEVNLSKEPGNRIENLRKKDGTLVKEEDSFIVAVNNYRYNSQLSSFGEVYTQGEDTLPELLEADVAGKGIRELIGDYITNVKGGVITPELSGNWKLTGLNWNQEDHAKAAELVNAGVLQLPSSADGRTPNTASVTKTQIQ